MRKNKKKYKNTKCIFGRNRKIQKKYKSTRCIFSYFLYLFCIFFVFLQKKYETSTKKYEKNTNPKSQKYKIQKKYKPKISKIQNTKKIRKKYESKISKIQNTKKKANPMFTFGRKTQIAKKMQKQHVVFSTPCSSDFVFSSRIIFVFFCIFNSFQHSLL